MREQPLQNLLSSCTHELVHGTLSLPVRGLAYDSRAVQPGDLFVAWHGLKQDGHRFIAEAIRRGCRAVVGENRQALEQVRQQFSPSPTLVLVPDSRLALAHLAAAFYQYPARKMKVIGVTGTNGKTTTTYLLESILRASGTSVGVIGTITYRYDGWEAPAERTTPEASDIQRLLHQMVEAGVEYCIMEVSSHALAWKRVLGCHFAVGLFTNLSQDHLDFHRDEEEYFQAKASLFLSYPVDIAVINGDDPWGRRLISLLPHPPLTYGRGREHTVSAHDLDIDAQGIRCSLSTPYGTLPLRSALLGEFNLHNILAAAAVGIGLNVDLASIKTGIEAVRTVPGRFERVEAGQDFLVVVDYAHTPEALRGVLSVARRLTPRRLITVFGCGGDRDRSKRPLMGKAVAEYSDYILLTSDNPRSEDPMAIIRAAEEGIKQVKPLKPYLTVPQRREAIEQAIQMATTGDIVVIAGKGHETYQIIGETVLPFDDRVVARDALQRRIKEREKGE
ncbi:MAG: UDP-N-acetylmuramoyl-L-alanyl-D-glutamate--2,6-diaminopimelate ligase [Nitrospinota bacterium]|nr:MAG: UDP-N-acetylmuramoyl-L-alanyl-D-glutamate--2,6-diaminopimelate ligase [Nitrospinota bacterium]